MKHAIVKVLSIILLISTIGCGDSTPANGSSSEVAKADRATDHASHHSNEATPDVAKDATSDKAKNRTPGASQSATNDSSTDQAHDRAHDPANNQARDRDSGPVLEVLVASRPTSNTKEKTKVASERTTLRDTSKSEGATTALRSVTLSSGIDTNPVLGLRIRSEDPTGLNHNQPGTAESLGVMTALDRFTFQDNRIVISNVLFLADENSPNPSKKLEHFFVWPENSLGSPISTAVFSNRTINSQGALVGKLEPQLVWHDPDNQRWFLPLSAIFNESHGYSAQNVSEEDTQFLTIELNLEDGRHLVIEVKYQVGGPLPRLEVFQAGGGIPSNPKDFLRFTQQDGWLMEQAKIVNPSSRSFNLWIRQETEKMELEAIVKVPRYSVSLNIPPGDPNDQYYRSTGALHIRYLEINKAGHPEETREPKDGVWEKIELGPNEAVSLAWLAQKPSNAVSCWLPLPTTVRYEWPNLSSMMGFSEYPVANEFEVVSIDWSYVGAQLRGQWKREMRMAPSWVSEQEATRNPGESDRPIEFITLDQKTLQPSIQTGIVDKPTELYPCQGFFQVI